MLPLPFMGALLPEVEREEACSFFRRRYSTPFGAEVYFRILRTFRRLDASQVAFFFLQSHFFLPPANLTRTEPLAQNSGRRRLGPMSTINSRGYPPSKSFTWFWVLGLRPFEYRVLTVTQLLPPKHYPSQRPLRRALAVFWRQKRRPGRLVARPLASWKSS